ncbi:MAG: helix-turn-helix domain-containing protein [Gammaproteobacteria bacterium]|nr:helix-turn-helix domain-containing protein [Gammaproteobacteria bacterium]
MKITTAKQLSSFLKDTRKSQGISQNKTASTVGIKQDTISKFEMSSANAQIDTMFKLLSALNLELNITPRSQHHNSLPNNSTQDQTPTEWNEEW